LSDEVIVVDLGLQLAAVAGFVLLMVLIHSSGLVGISAGFVVGMARLALIVASDAGVTLGGPLGVLADVNWLYFSFLLFVFTCVLIFVVSMGTTPASPEKLANLTFGTITPEQRARETDDYGFWEIAHSIVILGIIAGVYIAFW